MAKKRTPRIIFIVSIILLLAMFFAYRIFSVKSISIDESVENSRVLMEALDLFLQQNYGDWKVVDDSLYEVVKDNEYRLAKEYKSSEGYMYISFQNYNGRESYSIKIDIIKDELSYTSVPHDLILVSKACNLLGLVDITYDEFNKLCVDAHKNELPDDFLYLVYDNMSRGFFTDFYATYSVTLFDRSADKCRYNYELDVGGLTKNMKR